ncbi:hypothetical protein AL073_12000 [Loktanella sp. 1ANDIMAR09]|nr:hypothetical protein AL073_12000 [Loktanella sp. 1ANDIMAR09]
MKSLAFFNNKGGVGKTTLLCNVAAYFAKEMSKSVLVVDCDPQCNASQYLFDDATLEEVFNDKTQSVEVLFDGLMTGLGHSQETPIRESSEFGVDVVCGSPSLSVAEDFLAEEWASLNTTRGLSSTLVFANFLQQVQHYDYVFFDVSPSLGAINRTVLLSTDFYVSPMSIDIFSLKAFQNISVWMAKWQSQWEYAIKSPTLDLSSPILSAAKSLSAARFIGYVSQQYTAKRDASGERRPVKSFDEILRQIDNQIETHFVGDNIPVKPFEIGQIPNLHSLAPMSQSRRKPIFDLTGKDGVVGAHFAKVRESHDIFGQVAQGIENRMV